LLISSRFYWVKLQIFWNFFLLILSFQNGTPQPNNRRPYLSSVLQRYCYSGPYPGVSLRNVRSLAAHTRLGWQTIHQYIDPSNGDAWAVVAWWIGE
jgi:hypothetical protein